MFDKSGQWIHLETYDDFDNGLSELIDLGSGTASKAIKESALAHFKEDLEAAVLNWADNRAKSKKYAAIGEELAEFTGVQRIQAALPEAHVLTTSATIKRNLK